MTKTEAFVISPVNHSFTGDYQNSDGRMRPFKLFMPYFPLWYGRSIKLGERILK